jgi:hypothetical protein
LDIVGSDAGRQLPLDFGGHAGSAGIFPVRMPARLHFQIHSGQNRVAGARGVSGQKQPRLRMRSLRGQSRKTKAGCKNDSDASHIDIDARFGGMFEVIFVG